MEDGGLGAQAMALKPPHPASTGKRQRRVMPGGCQVDGCSNELDLAYHKKYHICKEHFKAACVSVGGMGMRFCQKCGHFQPVSEFEAEKRTCRVALEFHNARRRKRQRVLASGGKRGSPTDTSSDRSAPGRCSPHVRQQLQQPQPEQQRWQPPPQQQELTLLPPVQQPQQQQQAQQQVLVLDGMPLLAPLPDMSDAHVRPRLAPAQATPTAAFGPALRMLVHAQRLSPANDWDQPGRGGMAHTSTVPLPLPGTWGHPQQLPAAMFGSLLEMALVESLLHMVPANGAAYQGAQLVELLGALLQAQQQGQQQQQQQQPGLAAVVAALASVLEASAQATTPSRAVALPAVPDELLQAASGLGTQTDGQASALQQLLAVVASAADGGGC